MLSSVKNFTLLFFYGLASVNIFIFFMREIYLRNWWIGDAAIYIGTSFLLHLESLIVFLLYLLLITIFLNLILNTTKIIKQEKKNLNYYFVLILALFTVYIYVSSVFGISVAGSTENSAGSWQVIFYFISIDGLYFSYALIEKNTKRFFFISLLYAISNIVRGWASFPILLVIIFLIRNRMNINIKFFQLVILFIITIPIIFGLLYLREIFRSGTGIQLLVELQGYSGFELYFQIFLDIIKKIITRFDFYSNYIGISTLTDIHYMCYPYQENIYYKILLKADIVNECKSLGSILPSHLYDWFIGRGTSFAVSSGFFALPFISSIIYFFSNITILIVTSLIIRIFFNTLEIRLFFVQMVYFLFLQGWNYQFLYVYSGFLIGLFIINARRGHYVRNIRNK